MQVTKAVITAAGRRQRTLPLQMLIDRDGVEKSVLNILVEEALSAGIEDICVVVRPGDEQAYAAVVEGHASRLHFVRQDEPLGYGHAVYCARDFVSDDPFLHLVGDHLYVSLGPENCAQRLVAVAQAEECAVSAVQATRETFLPYFGAVGGRRVGRDNLYTIDTVIEKPTPTVAEQRIMVPGLRSGHYLCFFGMHVLTPTIMAILEEQIHTARNAEERGGFTLADALAELLQRERYLALLQTDLRYDVGIKYGLLSAQLALALNGEDREDVLAMLVELLAQRVQMTQRTAARR